MKFHFFLGSITLGTWRIDKGGGRRRRRLGILFIRLLYICFTKEYDERGNEINNQIDEKKKRRRKKEKKDVD